MLNKLFNLKFKKKFWRVFKAIFILTIFIRNFVFAQNILVVDPSPINFGNVFPGENISKDFTISLAQGINKAQYKVSLVSGAAPSVCDFISVANKENENDSLFGASLLKPQDQQDFWQIAVSIPLDIDLSQNYSSCAMEVSVLSYEGQPLPEQPSSQQISGVGGGAVPIAFLSDSAQIKVSEDAADFLPAGAPATASSSTAAAFAWNAKNQAKSKIVYDIFSHPAPNKDLANFGYSWGTNWGNFTKDHLKNIQGLKPATKYFYRIGILTPSGNIFISPEWYFFTVSATKEIKTSTSTQELKSGLIPPSLEKDKTLPPPQKIEKEPSQQKPLATTPSFFRNKNLGELLIILGILIMLLAYYLRKKEKK